MKLTPVETVRMGRPIEEARPMRASELKQDAAEYLLKQGFTLQQICKAYGFLSIEAVEKRLEVFGLKPGSLAQIPETAENIPKSSPIAPKMAGNVPKTNKNAQEVIQMTPVEAVKSGKKINDGKIMSPADLTKADCEYLLSMKVSKQAIKRAYGFPHDTALYDLLEAFGLFERKRAVAIPKISQHIEPDSEEGTPKAESANNTFFKFQPKQTFLCPLCERHYDDPVNAQVCIDGHALPTQIVGAHGYELFDQVPVFILVTLSDGRTAKYKYDHAS